MRAFRLPLWLGLAAGLSAGATEDRMAAATADPAEVRLSIVGTNDLHGRVLPEDGRGGAGLFAGYLRNLRAARARDGGGVVLLDAGDMLQGTLESNLGEGAIVVEAYNALRYDAAAIGNHEFDFGPAGPESVPAGPTDDPRGALKARASEARFPLLAANLIDEATGRPVDWPNVKPSVLVEVAGVRVGIVGGTTEETLQTTMAANVVGLRMAPLAETLAREASALRGRGAQVVIATVHAGGQCRAFDAPQDLSSCDPDGEILRVARALPAGSVDVIVGGHVHQAMAHVVGGIPIIQSYALGRAFGRVDLVLRGGRIAETRIFPPQQIVAGRYEGEDVTADAAYARMAADDLERARALRERPLGVTLADEFTYDDKNESEVGNLLADMMLAGAPAHADVALINGGGLRASLPAGTLEYGELFTAFPFDNRFALVRMSGAELRAVVTGNVAAGGAIVSLAGLRVATTCRDGRPYADLVRDGGTPLRDDETIVVATVDFLATGGGGIFPRLAPDSVRILDAPLVRDSVAEALARHGGTLVGTAWYDPRRPRLNLGGARPLRCDT